MTAIFIFKVHNIVSHNCCPLFCVKLLSSLKSLILTKKSFIQMARWSRNQTMDLLRSIIIVSIGTLMHIFSISIIELRYSNLPMLKANVASTIFTFSILCILSKARSFWPNKLRKPPAILLFICELAFVLYVNDFILRHTWLPCLKLINTICYHLSNTVVSTNKSIFRRKPVYIAEVIRNDVFFILRLLLSIAVFIIMLDVTGIAIFIYTEYKKRWYPSHRHLDGEKDIFLPLQDLNKSSTTSIRFKASVFDNVGLHGQINFDVRELPDVPPLDLLRPGYLVGNPHPVTPDKHKRRSTRRKPYLNRHKQ